MGTRAAVPPSAGRLFAKYGAISILPVLALGGALATSYRSEVRRRGRDEARSEAVLVAQTAVEPLLRGRPIDAQLTEAEQVPLSNAVARLRDQGSVLRLRVRNLAGTVVFSDDGSGLGDGPDDEALDAARGEARSTITHLNTDAGDHGPAGVAAAEVYVPLRGSSGGTIGVLEVYLPYAPIGADLDRGLSTLYRNLAVGLALLYAALFAITVSISRGLRRLVAANAFMAEHDPLTELPNRALFHRRAQLALAVAGPKRPVAVAIIDLDRFKEINDTLGHHNGDLLLTHLAHRLSAQMRPQDTVARLGGDEFGLILRDVTDAEGALRRLRDVIDQEIELSGLPVSIEASIGFAHAPEDGLDADELLQRADVAMYTAKVQHAGVVRYDDSQYHYDASKLGLMAELRQAIEADQLVLHYQPKATMPDGRIEAVEALVRWQHPKRGLLYPDAFLPLAEQTDLMDGLTAWVLRTALTEMGQAISSGGLVVAVNVSARNLGRHDFAARVIAALDAAGVPAQGLIIEITETALLADPERAATALRRLSEVGVKISIDDFGKGHTSLGYLAELPVDELKIDKHFVQDMMVNAAHVAIVQSIVDLGHNLALRVVGEGVETDEILARLQTTGCDLAQGFLLARPMPAAALAEWLAAVGEPAGALAG